MARLLPLVIAVVALIAGLGAGLWLRPNEAVEEAAHDPLPEVEPAPPGAVVLQLPNSFLVPLVSEGKVRAIVVVGLALQLLPDHTIDLKRDEARLRAVFLPVLFDYANLGGFDQNLTSTENLLRLRRLLRDAVRGEFGRVVHDVLIIDLLRQDMA